MLLRKAFVLFSLLLLTFSAQAGMFAQAGLHFGGDTLADVSFVGGGSEKVEAGGLLSGSIGYETDIAESFLMKLSIGFKGDFVEAENGSIDFWRIPITAMGFVKGEQFHYGIGLTQHTGTELSGDGAASISTVEFDDATGVVFQIDYLLNERGYVSFKYTSIDYTPVGSSVDFDGSSFGVLIGFKFGK